MAGLDGDADSPHRRLRRFATRPARRRKRDFLAAAGELGAIPGVEALRGAPRGQPEERLPLRHLDGVRRPGLRTRPTTRIRTTSGSSRRRWLPEVSDFLEIDYAPRKLGELLAHELADRRAVRAARRSAASRPPSRGRGRACSSRRPRRSRRRRSRSRSSSESGSGMNSSSTSSSPPPSPPAPRGRQRGTPRSPPCRRLRSRWSTCSSSSSCSGRCSSFSADCRLRQDQPQRVAALGVALLHRRFSSFSMRRDQAHPASRASSHPRTCQCRWNTVCPAPGAAVVHHPVLLEPAPSRGLRDELEHPLRLVGREARRSRGSRRSGARG